MARGRVVGVTGTTRVPIEHGWKSRRHRRASNPRRGRRRAFPAPPRAALPDRTDYDALDWWWRAPLSAAADSVLGFDGIATLWDAWLDGTHVASGDSMWAATEIALAHGASELTIRCRID